MRYYITFILYLFLEIRLFRIVQLSLSLYIRYKIVLTIAFFVTRTKKIKTHFFHSLVALNIKSLEFLSISISTLLHI